MSTIEPINDANLHQAKILGSKVNWWESPDAGDLPVIVMIHGFRGSHRGLLPLAAQLSGYRLIIPDLPGHGLSGPLNRHHDSNTYATWLEAFLNRLGITECYLLGHSYGSLVALTYVSRYPHRVIAPLMLISPVTPPDLLVKSGSLYYFVGAWLPERLRRRWLTQRRLNRLGRRMIVRSRDDKIVQFLMEEGEQELDELVPRVNVESLTSIYGFPFKDTLARLTLPTIVITGERDNIATLAASIKHYGEHPLVRLSVIHAMGHYGHVENTAEVAAVLRSELAAMAQSAPALVARTTRKSKRPKS